MKPDRDTEILFLVKHHEYPCGVQRRRFASRSKKGDYLVLSGSEEASDDIVGVMGWRLNLDEEEDHKEGLYTACVLCCGDLVEVVAGEENLQVGNLVTSDEEGRAIQVTPHPFSGLFGSGYQRVRVAGMVVQEGETVVITLQPSIALI